MINNTHKILIIDDDPDIRILVKKILSHHYENLEFTDNTHSALELLENTKYDCIVLDIQLNEDNGATILSHRDEKNLETPIVVMSQYLTDIFMESYKSKFSGFVPKPFKGQKLLDAVHAAITGTN